MTLRHPSNNTDLHRSAILDPSPHDLLSLKQHDYLPFLACTSDRADQNNHSLTTTEPIAIPGAVLNPRAPSRPRMYPTAAFTDSIMSVEAVPDSPPDLSTSKSSKSSSPYSSIGEPAGLHYIPHFEDITLEDLRHAQPQNALLSQTRGFEGKGMGKAPAARISVSQTSSNRSLTHSSMPIRDLTNTMRPRYPSLMGQVNGALKSQAGLGLPGSNGLRRGFTSPISPSSPIPTTSGKRSRPVSPSSLSGSYSSPRYSSHSAQRTAGSVCPHTLGPARRQSWQPNRKTVKEIEAEYHDSDEDVDEDAIMWNVPISPRPPHERSASHSPERADSGKSSKTNGYIPQGKHSSAPAMLPRSGSTSPLVPHRPGLPHARTTNGLPDSDHFSKPRTKSWNEAMADLSSEARMLTQALEEHAGSSERAIEEEVQAGGSRRPSTQSKRSAASSIIELPPVRRGDVLVDPLPISKEKEKVLTRTRPSWLPPKNPKEEKKHLKEYQRMMEASLEAEKRRAAKALEEQQTRDTTHIAASRIWEQHVLPNWATAIHEPRVRELWWLGVTPRSRGTVWSRAVGNELGLTEASYFAALRRAKTVEMRLAKMPEEERRRSREGRWFDKIRKDVRDVFPALKIFQEGGPLHEAIIDVLMAYSMYRSDLGYVYGTHVSRSIPLSWGPSTTRVSPRICGF